jgi:ATP-dependent Zn protease
LFLQIVWSRIQKTPAYFQSLSRKAKAIFILQSLTWMMILGLTIKSAATGNNNIFRYGSTTKQTLERIKREKPLEVSYSTFMDIMESHGKSTSTLRVDNVIIGKERIGFRVVSTPSETLTTDSSSSSSQTPTTTTPTLLPNILSRSNSRIVYTRKVDASPTLIDFLRQHDISFSAASTAAANTLGKVVSSAVVLVYLLVVVRMYRMMTGGGGGSGSGDVPGKLAQFNKNRGKKSTTDEPLVSFEDIRGIDGPKLEVMELVDTLRYPDKYAILGE